MAIENDKEIAEFLNHQKKGTKATYTSYLKQLLESAKENGKEILENRDLWKKKIFEFHRWLVEKGYAETYAQSATGCLRGLFAYYEKPLNLSRTDRKRLAERSRKTEDYLFDREDLGKMALCGNLKERYVCLVGKSIGLRAEDFSKLTYGKFRSLKLDSEPPIFIGETTTEKEHVKAFPFLDCDAIPIVKAILESNPKAKDTEEIFTCRSEELSVILQTVAKKAGIEPHGKRIRFHNLRKFLAERISAYASESQWKQIIGKKIEESAYVSHEQLRSVFKRAMKDIVINGNGRSKRIDELESALKQSETEKHGSDVINAENPQVFGECFFNG